MLASALGCLGAALSMSPLWPQVWRSCVRRRTTGLSATACWLGVALPIGWITYGLLIGDRLQVVTNSVTGGAGVAVLVALLLARMDLRTGRKLLVTAAGAAGVLIAAALSAGAAALPRFEGPEAARTLGAVLAVTSILAAVPQPLSLLRDRAQDLSGLSPLRWRLGAGACASWCGYGGPRRLPPGLLARRRPGAARRGGHDDGHVRRRRTAADGRHGRGGRRMGAWLR